VEVTLRGDPQFLEWRYPPPLEDLSSPASQVEIWGGILEPPAGKLGKRPPVRGRRMFLSRKIEGRNFFSPFFLDMPSMVPFLPGGDRTFAT